MTEQLPPMNTGLDGYTPPITSTEKAEQMLDQLAGLKKLADLKKVMESDPWALNFIEEKLETVKTSTHNRVVELYEADYVDGREAAGMLLMFGTDEYSDDRRLRLQQQIAVAMAREKLAKNYSKFVPVEHQSKVFEKLVSPNSRGSLSDSGPILNGALRSIVTAGAHERRIGTVTGKTTSKKEIIIPSS